VRRPEDVVIATLVGNDLADYIATACATALLLHAAVAENLAEVYATAIVTPFCSCSAGSSRKTGSGAKAPAAHSAKPTLVALVAPGAVDRHRLGAADVDARTHSAGSTPRERKSKVTCCPRADLAPAARGAARGALTHVQRDLNRAGVEPVVVRVVNVMIPRMTTSINRLSGATLIFSTRPASTPIFDSRIQLKPLNGLIEIGHVGRPFSKYLEAPTTPPQPSDEDANGLQKADHESGGFPRHLGSLPSLFNTFR